MNFWGNYSRNSRKADQETMDASKIAIKYWIYFILKYLSNRYMLAASSGVTKIATNWME